MLKPDDIFRINYRPPDAPNLCTIIAHGLNLGPGDDDEFCVDLDGTGGTWTATPYFGLNLAPWYLWGAGETDRAAVEDLRSKMIAALRSGPEELLSAWSKDLRRKSELAEDDADEDELDDDAGVPFDRAEMLQESADILEVVVKLIRASAKLRELDGPTLTVTIGGQPC